MKVTCGPHQCGKLFRHNACCIVTHMASFVTKMVVPKVAVVKMTLFKFNRLHHQNWTLNSHSSPANFSTRLVLHWPPQFFMWVCPFIGPSNLISPILPVFLPTSNFVTSSSFSNLPAHQTRVWISVSTG